MLTYHPKRKMSVISFEANGFTSTLTHMKKKIEELTNKNASTKILLYMVIHDLKHPTEALIENVNRMTQLLHFTQTQLAQALLENNELQKQLNMLMYSSEADCNSPLAAKKSFLMGSHLSAMSKQEEGKQLSSASERSEEHESNQAKESEPNSSFNSESEESKDRNLEF